MKTIIGVLFVFLVFLSLSCQKDNGIESSGNPTQKRNSVQKGNTNLGDGTTRKNFCRMTIVQNFINQGYSETILDYEYYNDAYVWYGGTPQFPVYKGDTVAFQTIASNDTCTFDIYNSFRWEGFTPVAPNTSFGYPEVAGFEIHKWWGDPDVKQIYINWLSKPYGLTGGIEEYTFSSPCYHPLQYDSARTYTCSVGYGVVRYIP
jgi:hypothetical protein